ncbi:MAG: hypothetical protein KME21_12870 [Desmonostoc vinosum HA7617-LM4]|nr:hypothetical protein [Desmonostoc vinosum HA7617-LM4]
MAIAFAILATAFVISATAFVILVIAFVISATAFVISAIAFAISAIAFAISATAFVILAIAFADCPYSQLENGSRSKYGSVKQIYNFLGEVDSRLLAKILESSETQVSA